MASFYKSGFPKVPFVGRKDEREFLSARLDEVMAGNGCSIFILGSPGIGKTRLALTALEDIEREGGLVLHGKARWRETPYVYEPFIEALRELRRRRKPFTSKELNKLIEPYRQDLALLLPELAGKQTEAVDFDYPIQVVDKYAFFEKVFQFFLNLSDYQPLYLLFDDAHWMDENSLELLGYIARQITHFPIALIVCYREAEVDEKGPLAQLLYELKREDAMYSLTLERLNRQETQRFIATMLDVKPEDVPDAAIEQIYHQTLGNPFFINESVLSLLERGHLIISDDKNTTEGARVQLRTSKERIALTDSIRTLVIERVERLPRQMRLALEIASVLGETFEKGVFQLATGMEEAAFEEVSKELVKLQFLTTTPEAADNIGFYHPKIQETVYDALPYDRRCELHGAIATALEKNEVATKLSPAWVGEYLTKLAYHFSLSEMHEYALKYLVEATRSKMVQFAYAEALWYCERAKHHIEQLPQNIMLTLLSSGKMVVVSALGVKRNVMLKLGELCRTQLRLEEAKAAFEWIFNSISTTDTQNEQLLLQKVSALHKLVGILVKTDRLEEALELLKDELLFMKRQSSPFAIRRSVIGAMILIYGSSKFRNRRKVEECYLELFENDKNISTARNLFNFYYTRNDIETAKHYASIALQYGAKSDSLPNIRLMNEVKSRLAWINGNFAKRAQEIENNLHIVQKMKDISSVQGVLETLRLVYIHINSAKALQYAEENARLLHPTQLINEKGKSLCYLAEVYLELGEVDKAGKIIQEAIEYLGWYPLGGLTTLAELALLRRDGEEALRWASEHEQRVFTYDLVPKLMYMPKIHRQKGAAYLILGKRESAQQEAEKLRKMIEAGGALADIGLAYGECALLLKALGQTDEALEFYRKAHEILQPGGATWRVAKLQEAFKDLLDEEQKELVTYTVKIETLPLKIHLFGGFQIERRGQTIRDKEWRSRKAKSVLKYLLLNRGKPIVRDILMDVFWCDMPPERASLNLNSTIYTIRRVLEPERPRRTPSAYLLTEGDALRFNADADFWLDVVEFERHLKRAKEFQKADKAQEAVGEWRAATEMYRGELLPEDRYEDWCVVQREQFREQYLSALLELGKHCYQRDEFETAEVYYKQVLAQEPYKEVALRMLMRCLVKLDRRNEALQWYRKVASKLADEMAVEPEPRTTALYEQIKNGKRKTENGTIGRRFKLLPKAGNPESQTTNGFA